MPMKIDRLLLCLLPKIVSSQEQIKNKTHHLCQLLSLAASVEVN